MIDTHPKKPCKFCGDPKPNHFPYTCPKNPKVIARRTAPQQRPPIARSQKPLKRTRLNPIGKVTQAWIDARAEWIANNPPDKNGYWYCYLRIHPWCPYRLTNDKDRVDRNVGMLTLDHVVSRTHDASRRTDQTNLRPACGYCNEMKGSRNLEDVKPVVL